MQEEIEVGMLEVLCAGTDGVWQVLFTVMHPPALKLGGDGSQQWVTEADERSGSGVEVGGRRAGC